MQVRIEVKVSAEGVTNDQYHQSGPVHIFGPLLDNGCTQGRQIIEEMTIAEEDRPEHVRHSKHDSGELHIGQRCPHFALPEVRRSVPTAGASARLAGMMDHFVLCGRSVDLRAERLGAAIQYLM